MGQLFHVTGDLLDSKEQVIAHGCNARGAMGAGIAGAISARYPMVHSHNRQAITEGTFVGGSCQLVRTTEVVPDGTGTVRSVFNLCTQIDPGPNGSYWLVTLAFGNMFEQCVTRGIDRVAIPRIGCGIAKLDWNTVEYLINSIYQWQPEGPDIVVYTHPSEVHKWR